jgi:hypothetical protein
MMRRAYSFLARGVCSTSGTELDALCVFFDGRCPVSELDFFDELETSLRHVDALPDCIIIIADTTAVSMLHRYWTTSHAQRNSFQARGIHKGQPFVKAYYFAAWNSSHGLSLVHRVETSWAPTLPLVSFVDQGLLALVRSNPVVQVAPAGHVFKHPSRTVNKLFIQAREIATSEVEVAFVGRCIIGALPLLATRDLSTVFVDTMGIYALVREALNFANVDANILSFHSYKEISELSPPLHPYAVVISASTTGGMARKLISEQGFNASRILTVLDSTRNARAGRVLVALDEVSSEYRTKAAEGTETQIELFGEHFSSKAKPPRAVTLGLPHSPKRMTDFLSAFGLTGLMTLNTSNAGSTTRRIVCINTDSVASSPVLEAWLREEVAWRVPAAIDHILCADDSGSRALAQTVAQLLHQLRGGTGNPPPVTAYANLVQETLANAQGVLVVQAVVGDGGLLREISRDLREFLPSARPRHFLAGVGLPQSLEAWGRLRQFLVRNPTAREYGFSSWLELPIGAEETSTAWDALRTLAGMAEVRTPTVQGVSANDVAACVDLAVRAIDAARNGFLNASNGNALALSDGFVFFGKVFDGHRPADVPISTTYTTIAAVLQSARELSAAENQLRPSGYESVVLSPENFLRYNDNILQACMLRAAHPSELDYSASPTLSRLMKEFLLKVFARSSSAYGSAALEFAASMACGRMRLISEDLAEVREKALQTIPSGASALRGLLFLTDA